MSEPSKKGYKRRAYGILQDIGIFEITEQRNEWLSKVEIEEMKRNKDSEV